MQSTHLEIVDCESCPCRAYEVVDAKFVSDKGDDWDPCPATAAVSTAAPTAPAAAPPSRCLLDVPSESRSLYVIC